jgi:ElaB/YqjD/DUF883 family membrane-anchored ribosome-binding protein
MRESHLEIVGSDVKTLVKDAQALFQSAAATTGENADEAYQRGMVLLDVAAGKVTDAKAKVLSAGEHMARAATGQVKENPWLAIGAAAGLGILAGLIVGRK